MADDMIGLALQAAYSAPSTYQRAGALAWVAGAVPGRLESARQTAEELALSIELHQDRSFALQQVAAATAYTDLARAESLVEAIPSTSQADQARGEIALTAAQRGHFDIARRLALVVEQPLQRAQVMASLASRLLDAGRPEDASLLADDAENTARLVVARKRLAESFIALAETMCRLGDLFRADVLVSRAESLAEETGTFIALGAAMVRAGRHAAARRLATLPESDDPVAIEVARALLQAGEFDQALDVARSQGDIGWRVQALAALADDLAEADDLDRARGIADEAALCLTTPSSVDAEQEEHFSALAEMSREYIGWPRLAETFAKLGQGTDAEAIVLKIRQPSARTRSATSVARLLASKGDTVRAVRLFKEAERAAVTDSDNVNLVRLLSDLVRTAGIVGIADSAASLLDRAESAAANASDSMQDQLMAMVAAAAASVGEFDRAERLSYTETKPAWDSHIQHISDVAEAMTAAGEHPRAEQLLAKVGLGRHPATQARLVKTLLDCGQTDAALRLARSIDAPDLAATSLAVIAASGSRDHARELLLESLQSGDWSTSLTVLADADPIAVISLADEFLLVQDHATMASPRLALGT